LVKDFLAKNNVTTLEHPQHSPELTPAAFYLFLRPKSAMKERCFFDALDISKNATAELKSLSQYDFKKCFQHFYSRRQKYVVAQGEYFEGNIA